MYQWWLVTAPSGLELAGEADSPAKVYILQLQSKKSCSKSCITIVLLYQHVYRSTVNACRVLACIILQYNAEQCNMHASLYYEYGMSMMLCINMYEVCSVQLISIDTNTSNKLKLIVHIKTQLLTLTSSVIRCKMRASLSLSYR